ncbi:MAG TPA: NADH-quinone oxidoreductase subunit J [Thermoanaerobaculia bacterium]|nr:NADH-quinone oxidoreductase subunit J [Thermoanaerobaculia bacterium]
MELAIFILFAGLALVSSIVVVTHKNPVYATLSLVLTLFSVAVLFVLLGAPFLAALQILIYAGAILVLFLFVLMLLNVGRQEGPSGHRVQLFTALLGGVAFAAMLVLLFWRQQGGPRPPAAPLSAQLVSLTALAQELFGRYLLQFEIVGLLLLVAVVGATVLARRPPPREPEAEP